MVIFGKNVVYALGSGFSNWCPGLLTRSCGGIVIMSPLCRLVQSEWILLMCRWSIHLRVEQQRPSWTL